MDVKIPPLGEGADSGTVATIFVKVGDVIKKDDPLIELESEKAVASVPSAVAGRVTQILVKPGDTVKVGQSILAVQSEGAPAEPAPAAEPVVAKPVRPAQPVPAAPTGSVPPASPSVRKIARELGIDLRRVTGTEPGGRISMADLRMYIQTLEQRALSLSPVAATAGADASPAPVEAEDFAQWGPVERKPMTQLRRTIARRMRESWTTIPQVTQFDEADLTTMHEWRKKHGAAYEKQGARLTFTPVLLKALVDTLKQHPGFNASLDEATQEIVVKQYYNIGIAVDTEQGLIVPVIRDVDQKSVLQLAVELEQLAKKTRERKIALQDMKGGTFTVSNQGGIGGGHFTPIVNKPEVAILGLGRGAVKPVVRDGQVTGRLILPLCLSYDHRVIDGGNAARFIADLVKAIETFPEEPVKL